MKQEYIDYLNNIYNLYLSKDTRMFSITLYDKSINEQRNILNCLDYLEECGYIYVLAKSTGYRRFKITVNGINFVENNFTEQSNTSIIQGDNSIYVNGSSNSITGNYNHISVDISQSDLPEDCKELIYSFLKDMENSNANPEEKLGKIKTFLRDISSGTISGTASRGLVALISSLFSHVPL